MQFEKIVTTVAVAVVAGIGTAVHAQELECLTTKVGVPLKVIVRQDSAIYEEPAEQSASQPVKTFEWFYVLPADKTGAKTENGFFRVSQTLRESGAVGWLKEDVLVEWPHRQAAGFRPSGDRQRLKFFRSFEDLEQAYSDNDVEPLSREPANTQGALMPLLDVRHVQFEEASVPVYRVAYLHSAGGAAGSSPAGERTVTREELIRDFTLDVTFVVDTTASMQPWIDGVKEVIRQITTQIGEDPTLAGRVRFGMVGYRDKIAGPGMEYLSNIYCDLKAGSDHDVFRERLSQVREAPVGSEDFPEDVLAGLDHAIREAEWNPTGYKVIILIGDASAQLAQNGRKNPKELTIPGVLAAAQPTGESPFEKIVVHGLRIVGNDPDDHARCREHFEKLTRGRDLEGLHLEYRSRADGEKFVEELLAALKEMVEATGKIARGEIDELKRSAKGNASGQTRQRLLGPVLEMVRATEEGGQGSGPSFASGWVSSIDPQGNLALEPRVMVTRGRLSVFNSILDLTVHSLKEAEPGEQGVKEVVKALQIAATNVNLGEPVTADMPLEKLFSFVLGFPVRNDVFSITPGRLAAMPEADFQAWREKIQAVKSILGAHLGRGDIWHNLVPGSGSDRDRVAFIKVSDLP